MHTDVVSTVLLNSTIEVQEEEASMDVFSNSHATPIQFDVPKKDALRDHESCITANSSPMILDDSQPEPKSNSCLDFVEPKVDTEHVVSQGKSEIPSLLGNQPLQWSEHEPSAYHCQQLMPLDEPTLESIHNEMYDKRKHGGLELNFDKNATSLLKDLKNENGATTTLRQYQKTPTEAINLVAVAPAPKRPTQSSEVIDLLDSDSEDAAITVGPVLANKKVRLQKNTNSSEVPSSGALASYQARSTNIPEWMKAFVPEPQDSLSTDGGAQPHRGHLLDGAKVKPETSTNFQQDRVFNQPHYIPFPPNWKYLQPFPSEQPRQPQPQLAYQPERKVYKLSLLNVNEFTIECLSPGCSIKGLRVPIRQISRNHGKAVYERGQEDGGKWRIPLGAYHDFAAYLKSEPTTKVHGIPPNQLQIATLERTRQEKGYPEAENLIERGVPKGLAYALAPFQRGGVDFVREKEGRALIADDMGLGKTIQGVASMSLYCEEWPVLILCPSGARYQWENEFKHWLGVDSPINKDEKCRIDRTFPDCSTAQSGPLLNDWQINVLTSAKASVCPFRDTKIVICSYGLAPTLIENGVIKPRMFRCAIVDESHMLKNKSTKRTKALLPILAATDRCVLLSGTPALSRPLELWPQLAILKTEAHGWGDSESEFIDKYVKNGNSLRSAELHTMLTGTVMIRRLKNDILKSMPRKVREKAAVHVAQTNEQRNEFKELLNQLRDGRGALGTLARIHHSELAANAAFCESSTTTELDSNYGISLTGLIVDRLSSNQEPTVEQAELASKWDKIYSHEMQRARQSLEQDPRFLQLDFDQRNEIRLQMEGMTRTNLDRQYREQLDQMSKKNKHSGQHMEERTDSNSPSFLSRLYNLTGNVKIPLIADMLKRFLNDKTKGKICIFAHHISVLNAIRDDVGLLNDDRSDKKYIRIDGSTLPKSRQEQITAFQTDPTIRVALLGITAAGVAVTLTASSTVWFAELFWTPALMIQAEDRCHRIGQSAQVKCLYFVAKGTLDELLWKLIEKKFCDLGEFVEGKEKLKLIVDNEYNSVKDLHLAFFNADVIYGSDDDDVSAVDDHDFQIDNDWVHDIEELGEDELRMLQESEELDDADCEPITTFVDNNIQGNEAVEQSKKIVKSSCKGRTEDDAIALLDDDGDETEVKKKAADGFIARNTCTKTVQPPNVRHGSRLYRIIFSDSFLGLEVTLFQSRIIVTGVSEARRKQLGDNSKPSAGDILVGIEGNVLQLVNDLHSILRIVRDRLRSPPTELMFVEAPNFYEAFKRSQENAQVPASKKRAIQRID